MTLLRCNQKKGARSSLSGSSAGSWVLELCLGKEKAGPSKVFLKIFGQFHQQKIHLLAKICWAGQLEYQKLHQLGKEQCLPSAVHGG
jgi:hypothetical protein